MAIQHIETLDDPVQSTGSLQWAGQVSGTKPNRIQDDEAAELVNVDLTPDGMLCPRPACVSWKSSFTYGPGMTFIPLFTLFYVEVPGLKCLFAFDPVTQLWVYNANAQAITPSDAYGPKPLYIWPSPYFTPDPVIFAQLINVVYMANGTGTIGVVTVDPAGPPYVAKDSIATFDDDVTALPNISYVAEHRGRIFAAQKDSDIIWPSSILGVTATGGALVSFKLTDGIRVGKGEGDPIVALVPSRDNELLVFCKNSVWSVSANPLQTPDNWTITAITRQVGLVGPRAWTWVGNDVWFWSPIGVTSIRRVIAGDDQEMSPILSNPIKDVIDQVNLTFSHNIKACTLGSRVLWAVPMDLDEEPTHAIVYNIHTSHWMGIWTGACHSMEVCRIDGYPVIFATSKGMIATYDAAGMEDNYTVIRHNPNGPDWTVTVSAPVESMVRTKSYNWGDFKQLKSPESMEVECWEGAGEMDVMVQLDGQDESTLYPFLTVAEDVSLDVLPRFPLRFPIRFEWNNSVRRAWDLLMRPGMRECREMAVVLKLRGRWRLREVMVNAYINTYEIEK